MEKKRNATRAKKLLKRMRRSEQSIVFINECQKNAVIPQFCRIREQVRESLHVSKNEIRKIERKGLHRRKIP